MWVYFNSMNVGCFERCVVGYCIGWKDVKYWFVILMYFV